ncbi:MAG: dihydropteroate synthase [Alistipes onderdonkii]
MAANNPLFDFSQPRVMAILNVTPDSFFAGSRMPDAPHVERRVREAVAEGASIIDVGGYSSRPGADEVSPGEEWRRVELGLVAVRRLAPAWPFRSIHSAARSLPGDRKVRPPDHQRHFCRGTRSRHACRRCEIRCPTSPCT